MYKIMDKKIKIKNIKKLKEDIFKFRKERDWEQFHTPENLAKSIVIESAELLECFQWGSDFDKKQVEEELGDIFNYLILMEKELGIDLIEVTKRKLEKNKKKYSIKNAKGNSKKYTKF